MHIPIVNYIRILECEHDSAIYIKTDKHSMNSKFVHVIILVPIYLVQNTKIIDSKGNLFGSITMLG